MSHQIIKFNEGSALAAGWPRDLVATIRHLVASVGTEVGQATLPTVAAGLDEIGFSPLPSDPLAPVADPLPPAPVYMAQVEFLQTEVRQMAEHIASLQQQINDLNQGTL